MIVRKKLTVVLLLVTLAILDVLVFAALSARAQEPVEEFVDPFTPPELVQGEPYMSSLPAYDFTVSILPGPCDYLPVWVDNSGGEVLPPGFPDTGDVQDILDWTGLEVSRLHGCERARDGETYLSLEALELKCGAAVVQVRADRDGVSLADVLFWMNWPGMDEANQMTPEVDPRYFEEGVGGFTDAGGSVGWGYGGGSFITPGIGGPFSVWGNSCLDAGCRYGVWVGADALLRTGWFGGTPHCTINPWFEPRVKEGDGSPPAGNSDAWLGVFDEGELLYHVPLLPGMPGGSFDEFSGLGYIAPDGAWLWHAPGVEGQPQ